MNFSSHSWMNTFHCRVITTATHTHMQTCSC